MRIVKKYPLINVIHHTFFIYPAPSNLSYLWNFGSLAFICLGIQIVSGIFLAMHYVSYDINAFASVEHIMRDINSGWALRYLHANGASMFFIVVYCHIFRGLYYSSYAYPREILWIVGVLILLIMILTAFMGYVLPWGQMSFWAATVITNLASAIPYGIGENIVLWLWGGFSVGGATLTRFYSFHYLFPFIIFALSFIHIVLLHENGSNNPLGIGFRTDFVNFSPYYLVKDFFGVSIFLLIYIYFAFFYPNYLGHTDNYIMANSLVTPTHIVPEWYFLPFYAILRSVPDKLIGVLLLLGSIFILIILPFYTKIYVRSSAFKPLFKIGFWFFVVDCVFLGWLGGKPIETPFLELGKAATIFYFVYFLILIPIFTFIESFVWYPFNLKKIGALTSKVSAFKIRPWEVKNIETIDILDSNCISILVSKKNNKIERILPFLNKEYKNEWISDRSRFVYDSISKRLINNPLLFYKNYNNFYYISWKNIYKLIYKYINKFNPQINQIFGSILDLENSILLKKFSNKNSFNTPINFIQNNLFNNNWNKRFFYLSILLNKKKLIKYNKIFLLGLDIRYDLPILNIELRQLKKNCIYLIGPLNFNLNYNYVHLGTNLNKKKFKKYLLNLSIKKEKNLILLGNDWLNNNNINKNNLLSKNNRIYYLSDKLSILQFNEIGLNLKKNESIKKNYKNYLYILSNLENITNISFLEKKNILPIYIGTYFNNIKLKKKKIFSILPSLSSFEDNQYFLNCFGLLKKSKICINNKNETLKKWKFILLELNFYLNKYNIEYSNYYTVLYQYNEYLKNKKISKINFKILKKKILLKKNSIKKMQNNFYLRTTISRNSLFCILGQKNIKKKKYYE